MEQARMLNEIGFMTDNEKREAIGMQARKEPHADKLKDPDAAPPGGQKPKVPGSTGTGSPAKDKPKNEPKPGERGGSGRQ